MATVKWVLVIWLIPALALAARGEKRIAVFVGLADNATQGIAKVGAKIGDGDQPDDNLYWGCTDGLKSLFKTSSKWKLEQRVTDTGDPRILERLVFRHANPDALLVAEAWRGAKLRDCYEAFQQAGVSGNHDLVAFIGHNVLMDTKIALPTHHATMPTDAAILCCLSESYFRDRLESTGLRPILLTTQRMYPGAFLLHDAIEPWLAGKDRAVLRTAAGAAYARNQHISQAAATGVFADLALPNRHPIDRTPTAQDDSWRATFAPWPMYGMVVGFLLFMGAVVWLCHLRKRRRLRIDATAQTPHR